VARAQRWPTRWGWSGAGQDCCTIFVQIAPSRVAIRAGHAARWGRNGATKLPGHTGQKRRASRRKSIRRLNQKPRGGKKILLRHQTAFRQGADFSARFFHAHPVTPQSRSPTGRRPRPSPSRETVTNTGTIRRRHAAALAGSPSHEMARPDARLAALGRRGRVISGSREWRTFPTKVENPQRLLDLYREWAAYRLIIDTLGRICGFRVDRTDRWTDRFHPARNAISKICWIS
jgi:hypothetical protein